MLSLSSIRILFLSSIVLSFSFLHAGTPDNEPLKPPTLPALPDPSTPTSPTSATPGTTINAPDTTPKGTSPDDPNKPAPTPAPTSLYVRINGMPKLADIADVLVERISKNELLNTNEAFRKVGPTLSRPALRYHITTALCQICGGPERYNGMPLHELFQEIKFTPEQWKAFTTELEQSLDGVKVSVNEKREVLDYAEQIYKFSADTAARFVKAKGMAMLLPNGWQIGQNPDSPMVVMMANGPEPKEGGPRATILVLNDELMQGLDLTPKEYMRSNQLIASKQVKTIKNLSAQSMIFNGDPLESFSYNAGEGKTEMYVETYFMIRNKRGIAIQFSTLTSEKDATKPQFIEALRTLKFE